MRLFRKLVLVAILPAALLAGAAHAEDSGPDRQAFEELLTAFGEPPQLICMSGMKSAARMIKADHAGAATKAKGLRTEIGSSLPIFLTPFDTTAATDVATRIGTAMAATTRPELLAKYDELKNPATITAIIAGAFDRIGLSPDNAIDVTAAYLAYVWAAQEGQYIFADDDQMKAAVATIRDQVTLAEAVCFQLGAIGDALPDARNLMIARTGFVIDGLEVPDQAGEDSAFGAYVRRTSGVQIKGLTLGPNGFE